MQNLGFSLADFDPATGFARVVKIAGVVPPVVPDSDPNQDAMTAFETELVINPLVKFGDTVAAGQEIAEVSDYASAWKDIGLGIVERGDSSAASPRRTRRGSAK